MLPKTADIVSVFIVKLGRILADGVIVAEVGNSDAVIIPHAAEFVAPILCIFEVRVRLNFTVTIENALKSSVRRVNIGWNKVELQTLFVKGNTDVGFSVEV